MIELKCIYAVTTGVNFTRVDENIYFIQCSYLSGSDVSGCIYVLVRVEEGVENVTGFIERDSNGVTLEVANIGCYTVKYWPMNSPQGVDISLLQITEQASPLNYICPIGTGERVLFYSTGERVSVVYVVPSESVVV